MTRSHTLRPRKIPRQARARATVETILDAAAALLKDVGVERLTTNAIAERAGINVAALYSYYPNKFAVLAALWDRMQERQRGVLRGLAATTSLAQTIDAGVDATFKFVLREPGFVELADAVRTLPELRELSRQAHSDAAVLLRDLLVKRRRPPRSAADVETVAGVIVEASSAILAYARRASAQRRSPIVTELKRMLTAYLSAAGDFA